MSMRIRTSVTTPGGFVRPEATVFPAAPSMLRRLGIHRIDSSDPYFGVGKSWERKYYFSYDKPTAAVRTAEISGDNQ
jgi:hypothetical protein